MRRLVASRMLILGLVATGCRTPDRKAIDGTKHEVKVLGEKVKLDDRWTPEQLATVDAEVAAINSHIEDIAK